MKFTSTPIPDAWIIDSEPTLDERGSFARLFSHAEFLAHGIDLPVPEVNISLNFKRGTLRGIHYQLAPHDEGKLIHCTTGAVFDVIVDLRQESATLGHWFGLELSAIRPRALYAPPGCGHGYVSLTDEAMLFYLMSDTYVPAAARGVRWNDPRIGIQWPMDPVLMSERDKHWPDWTP